MEDVKFAVGMVFYFIGLMCVCHFLSKKMNKCDEKYKVEKKEE